MRRYVHENKSPDSSQTTPSSSRSRSHRCDSSGCVVSCAVGIDDHKKIEIEDADCVSDMVAGMGVQDELRIREEDSDPSDSDSYRRKSSSKAKPKKEMKSSFRIPFDDIDRGDLSSGESEWGNDESDFSDDGDYSAFFKEHDGRDHPTVEEVLGLSAGKKSVSSDELLPDERVGRFVSKGWKDAKSWIGDHERCKKDRSSTHDAPKTYLRHLNRKRLERKVSGKPRSLHIRSQRFDAKHILGDLFRWHKDHRRVAEKAVAKARRQVGVRSKTGALAEEWLRLHDKCSSNLDRCICRLQDAHYNDDVMFRSEKRLNGVLGVHVDMYASLKAFLDEDNIALPFHKSVIKGLTLAYKLTRFLKSLRKCRQ